jgi:hypothetical protein
MRGANGPVGVLEDVIPAVVERRHPHPAIVAFEPAEAFEFAERIVDLEIDVDAERRQQPCLDLPVQRLLVERRIGLQQEKVGEESLLALLLSAVYVTVATAVHSAIVLLADAARPWLEGGHRSTVVRRVLSLLLVGIAAWLFLATHQI